MVEPAECAGSAFDAAGWPPIGAAGRDGSAAVSAGGGNWPPWLRTPDAVRLTKPTAPIAVPTLVRIPVRIRASRQHRGFRRRGDSSREPLTTAESVIPQYRRNREAREGVVLVPRPLDHTLAFSMRYR